MLIRSTLLAIEKYRWTSKVFVRIIYDALTNDYISHAIKIFEQSSRVASFWYLHRANQKPIEHYARRSMYDLFNLQAVAAKLKVIRNGTHFHIDGDRVVDTESVWKSAGLTGTEAFIAGARSMDDGRYAPVQLTNFALATLAALESFLESAKDKFSDETMQRRLAKALHAQVLNIPSTFFAWLKNITVTMLRFTQIPKCWPMPGPIR